MKLRLSAPARFALVALAWICPAVHAVAQSSQDLVAVRNDKPSFYIRMKVDHPNQTYVVGDKVEVTVSSERPGYLFLFYLNTAGKLSCVFPNQFQRDNAIPAGNDVVTVPPKNANFRFRVAEPCGRESLKAVVCLKQLQEVQVADLIRSKTTNRDLRVIYDAVRGNPADWSEHSLDILTVPSPGGIRPPGEHRRIGVFVGVCKYLDPSIRPLKASDKDAEAMAGVMKRVGKLDKIIVLLNEQATRAAIEDVFCRQLAEGTRAGDEVFLFWSGHGSRCASTDPNKKDGVDEFLVPYDGRLDDTETIRRTMLLDDTFGSWMLKLGGRRIVVILDTCYAGGQHNEAKSLEIGRQRTKALDSKLLGKSLAAKLADRDVPFDFFNLTRIGLKALGQKELAMLASSKANETSFERREGDLGVMTYCLVNKLGNSDQPVTLPQAFESLKQDVPRYVEGNFLGSTQTPVLVDETTPPTYLRP